MEGQIREKITQEAVDHWLWMVKGKNDQKQPLGFHLFVDDDASLWDRE